MKRNMIFLIVISIIFFRSALTAQDKPAGEFTLKDIVERTLKNHPLIKQKADELRAARFGVEQQKSYYLPNVNAEASYTRIGPIPAFSFGGQNLELAPANNYNIGVFVSQTLYDFGKRELQVEYASSMIGTIKDAEELVKADLTDQAIKNFYGILFLEKTIAVKDTQAISLEEHLKITELRIKNGTATDYDLLSTRTRLAEIKNEKIDLLNEKNKQEIFLKEIAGLDRSEPIKLNGDLTLPIYDLNLNALIAAAFNNRPEIKLSEDSKNSALIQKNLFSHIDNPVLSASAGYGFKNGYEPNIEVLRGNWYANLSVNVPIFNGNLTENKVNQADAQIDAADKKIQETKENITTEVYQTESNLKSSMSKIKSTEEQMEYAAQSLERAKLRYRDGTGTNLEVLDSETALTQAHLLNVQAVYKSIISYYSLRRAVGDFRNF